MRTQTSWFRALTGSAVLVAACMALGAVGEEHAAVLFDIDTARHQPTAGADKQPIGAIEVVPGRMGNACRFTFKEGARGFFTAPVRSGPEWDRAGGISFWVKGDGSATWGGLEMIDGSDYALRYGYCFPIDSTEWRKVTVAWSDLVPELPAGDIVDPGHGYAPSRFGNLWFGKWFYWGSYPGHSFTIDHIVLEPSVAVDTTDYTPVRGGAPKLLKKLEARQPVTIVTMGDSLSDKRHWANREVLWAELLVERLKQQFGGEVTLVNPAIGGTQLTQNLVLAPRWLKDTPHPDLITIWFGFNDWDGGMRGPQFARRLGFAVDRLRRLTGGKSEILLVTTCPAIQRWDTMEELAAAVRTVAAGKKTAIADVAAAFHTAGSEDPARAALFAWDRTHLAPDGHKLAAETVYQAIVEPAP